MCSSFSVRNLKTCYFLGKAERFKSISHYTSVTKLMPSYLTFKVDKEIRTNFPKLLAAMSEATSENKHRNTKWFSIFVCTSSVISIALQITAFRKKKLLPKGKVCYFQYDKFNITVRIKFFWISVIALAEKCVPGQDVPNLCRPMTRPPRHEMV